MASYTDEQLVAFIDGELPSAHMRAIERAIETDPELSVRVASLHMETGGLKALFDSWLNQAPKEKLGAMLPALYVENNKLGDQTTTRQIVTHPIVWGPALILGAVGLLVGYGLGKTFGADPIAPPEWITKAAHEQVIQGPVAATGLVGLTEASSHVGLSLDPSSLQVPNTTLLGAELESVEGNPMSRFLFEDAAGQGLALSVVKSGAAERARQTLSHDGLNAVYWSLGGYSFALIGAAELAGLDAIAQGFIERF